MWVNGDEYEAVIVDYNKALDKVLARDKTIKGLEEDLARTRGSISKKEAESEKELSEARSNIHRFMEAGADLHPTIFGPTSASSIYFTLRNFAEIRMTQLTEQFELEIKRRDERARITKFMEEVLYKYTKELGKANKRAKEKK